MSKYDISEIINFAIRIEENGEQFYRIVAESTDNEELKDLFNYLADEEVNHKKVFSSLLSKLKDYNTDDFPEEYFAYLRAYADNMIFNLDDIDKESGKIKDIKGAVDYAIKKELDSIMLYQELKDAVPENQHPTLNKIIQQERNHFIKLSTIKENLLS